MTIAMRENVNTCTIGFPSIRRLRSIDSQMLVRPLPRCRAIIERRMPLVARPSDDILVDHQAI